MPRVKINQSISFSKKFDLPYCKASRAGDIECGEKEERILVWPVKHFSCFTQR